MDPDTIQRAADGDPTALDRLFERHMGPLVAFIRVQARGVVAAGESVMDLAQSVCREVLQDLGRFEARDEAAFRNWLLLQAIRKIRNRYRYHHRQCRDVARLQEAQDSDALSRSYACFATPSRRLASVEEIARIEAAIQCLPEDQREAVMMSRILELPYEEIAQLLGRTPSAVRGLVARGLAALSRELSD